MNTRAQAIVEYSVIIIVVITALAGMQVYFKRGIQDVIRARTDELGAAAAADYKIMTGQEVDYQVLGGAERGLAAVVKAPKQVMCDQSETNVIVLNDAVKGEYKTSLPAPGVGAKGTFTSQAVYTGSGMGYGYQDTHQDTGMVKK